MTLIDERMTENSVESLLLPCPQQVCWVWWGSPTCRPEPLARTSSPPAQEAEAARAAASTNTTTARPHITPTTPSLPTPVTASTRRTPSMPLIHSSTPPTRVTLDRPAPQQVPRSQPPSLDAPLWEFALLCKTMTNGRCHSGAARLRLHL